MPGLYKDEGIVLRSIKLGEADRIVTIYTRDNGKIRAVAKGVRKTKSRFGGRLEPYARIQLLIYRGRNLDTITSADILEAFPSLTKDYTRLASAAAMAELVEKITPDRESSFSTYSLLLGGLRSLAGDDGGAAVPAFLMKVLSISGYHPELKNCAGCGIAGFHGGFSPAQGGAVCEGCWREDHASIGLHPDRIVLMSRLLKEEFGWVADPLEVDEVTQALRAYAEYHLERPLRSFQMLKAV